jgi:hypothetical protein
MPTAPSLSFNPATNQIGSVNGQNFQYDAAGNVTWDRFNSYLYDAEGRLCAVDTRQNLSSQNPNIFGYVYDAAGTRVAKGILSSLSCDFATNGFLPVRGGWSGTSWVLGPGGEQVTEYAVTTGTSTWVHTNAFADGKLLATYRDSNTYFALEDWLGTKRVEVSADNSCGTAFRSLPYGNGLTPPITLPGYSTSCVDATRLSLWLMRQGIALHFSGIRHPQTQGKVERFHGSMERALDCRGVPADDHQQWLDEFRREHNHIRPHEALQMQTPASRWQPSPRSYQPNPPAWQYPEGAWTLKVDIHGTIDIRERPYRISKALTGERVRILPVEDRYLIYYCNTLIRELDPATGRATLIDRFVEGQPPAEPAQRSE